MIAIRDLIGHVDKVEIPIYLCDSIMTPSEYGGLFGLGKSKELKTAAATFLIPTEITTNRDDVARYAEQLEFCIRNGYSADEFIERCRDESLPVNEEALHAGLFDELVKLDKANKNGVWARIIKNAFAPLFIGQVDYVAGNPPWVNWENLPADYRASTLPLWDRYNLRPEKGELGRMRGGKKDLSMLFVYTSIDSYLKENCHLGFVITQTVFKTRGSGDGFRHFRFEKDGKEIIIKPIVVHDLSSIQVFEGATNRTAVFISVKTRSGFDYPVTYVNWSGPSRIEQEENLQDVYSLTRRETLGAVPVEINRMNAPWLTASPATLPAIRKTLGTSDYKAYEGVNTGGLNGCYWVRIIKKLPNGNLLIENLHDIGKIKLEKVQTVIEPDFVYPLLRGRDVIRWQAIPSLYILAPQDPVKRREGIPESEMRRKYPKTYAYFKQFENKLSARPDRKYYPAGSPFYTMRNMASYTLAPWKVVWRDMGDRIQVAVIGDFEGQPICPEHHVMAIPLASPSEAYFISGVLMSSPIQLAVAAYTTSIGISAHVLESVKVPRYDQSQPLHNTISRLAKACHLAAEREDVNEIAELEKEIDKVAIQLWKISKKELRAVQDALVKTEY